MGTDCETASVLRCTYNGCELKGAEEIESPHTINGDIVCDDCYDTWRWENESECPFCCDYYLDDELSDCFVFTDEDDESHLPGLYRMLSYPRYLLPTPDAEHFNGYAVQRIGCLRLGAGVDIGTEPTAYVCEGCMGDGDDG